MIELKSINKVYQTKTSEVKALVDVNLSFSETGLVFILGKSGCGKSTLLNIMGCLDRPTSGEFVVDNNNVSQLNSSELDYFRNYNVGFIFQDYNLVEEYNVYENIELVLDLQGEVDAQNKISDVLEKVGLSGYEKRKIKELSGGQQQRVAIARAIIKNTSYILADEPTGNLDSATSEDIFNLLKEISKEKLIIVVTHDKENAEQYGDRIIRMKDGAIVEDNTNNCNAVIENNSSKIDTKVKKISFKQVFKFALRNMWRRKIRLIASVVLCACCLGVFGFSLSFTRYDCYKKYASVVDEYKPGYQIFGNLPGYGGDEDKQELNIIDSGKVAEAINLFDGAVMPIYTDGDNVYAVLTEENVEYFPFILFDKVPDRDAIIPQKYDEVVRIEQYNSSVSIATIARYRECKEIAVLDLQMTNGRQRLKNYYQKIKETKYDENLIGPETKRIQESTDEEIDELISNIEGAIHNINYFVHPDFVTEILPNRCGDNYINFSFKEWVFKDGVGEELYSRKSAGYFYNLSTVQKFADELVFLPQYSGKTKLQNNEVVISVEFAKILLSGIEQRLTKDISDNEARDAVITGQVRNITLRDDNGLPFNATIVGYYDVSTSEWLSWNDDLKNQFSQYKYNEIYNAPFVVSDELYNNEKPVESGCIGLLLNFDKIDLNGAKMKFLFSDINKIAFYNFTILREFSYYNHLYEHNLNTSGPIFMYIALGSAILCIIAILSYIWAVIHDSKHKIGVLRAQGMSNLSIILIYAIESLVVCGIAIFIGLLAGLGFSNWLWLQSVLSVEGIIHFTMTNFGVLQIFSVLGLGLAIGLLGAILPIAINSKKSPVSLIK